MNTPFLLVSRGLAVSLSPNRWFAPSNGIFIFRETTRRARATKVGVGNLSAGHPPPKRPRKFENLNARLISIVERYDSTELLTFFSHITKKLELNHT